MWFRVLAFPTLMLLAAGSALAQRSWDQRAPAPRDIQFYQPRNKLEELEGRVETVLIRGRTYVGTLKLAAGSLRVEATEVHDSAGSVRATGVVIEFLPNDNNASETHSSLDYEEVDPLVKAIDSILKADESITRLTNFEVHYRTRGDFEAMIMKQVSGNVVVAIEGGFFDRVRFFLTPDELTKLRWFIVQAKEKLDGIK